MEARANVRTELMDRAEILHSAIQQLREEENNNKKKIITSSTNILEEEEEEEEGEQHLLARLLSQLESKKGDNIDLSEPSSKTKALISSAPVEANAKGEECSEDAEIGIEEIVKELRVIRRQNTVTHWLLSALIVITAVWQVSEVSLLLCLKDTVKHPFKAIGGLIAGSLGRSNETDATKSNLSSKQHQIEGLPLPHQIKMPELPNMDLSSLGLSGNRDRED